MTKIRKLYFFDKKNTKEIISFLNNEDYYTNYIMFNPFVPLHHLLPLRFKFLPESYISKDNKNIKGLITIAPTRCPLNQMEIQKLLFEENQYEEANELIQFVVSKYKALGTASIITRIDDNLPELIKLFILKCGFSQISYEKTWQINIDNNRGFNESKFRSFHNSDAQVVSNIYKEQLLPHFRPLLGKIAKEFKYKFFTGLSYCNEYKYVYYDKISKTILAYLSIKTSDNKNYILDIIQSSWEEIDLDEIFAFVYANISKRSKKAKLYILTKRYTQQGEKYENLFLERKYNCIKNKIVLTNSSAKIIKNDNKEKKFTVLNSFFNGISITNKNSL